MVVVLLACLFSGDDAFAHAVTQGDKGYIQEISGVHLLPFTYLGAKHMMTGYDHILFLFGVIFFLYKLSHIAVYVSLFPDGHPKLPHLWPVKLPQARRPDYDGSGLMARRAAASLRR